MAVRVIAGKEELLTLVGSALGHSDWIQITQERIDAFANATDDRQWIHTDPERAKRESPYGSTIAHGFLTLSLIGGLSQTIFDVTGLKMLVNYGLNRVRFPSAVKVGARVRLVLELIELKESRTGVQAICRHTIEVEGEDRPACVAEQVLRLFF